VSEHVLAGLNPDKTAKRRYQADSRQQIPWSIKSIEV